MPRNKIEDIKISRTKNTSPRPRVHTAPRRAPEAEPKKAEHSSHFKEIPLMRRMPPLPKPEGKKRSYMIWIAAVLAAIILFVAFSTFFESATLKITPEQKVLELDGTFVAERSGAASVLPFEVMLSHDSETRQVEPSVTTEVERKASGRIIIYNDFSTASQRLIKNTRFETPEGLVFRIRESVVVPGQTVAQGQKIPGSIEATIFADEAGDKYNSELTDFTVPGFKGTPRYDKFYARSKTEISGGFSGVQKIVPEEDLVKIRSELRESVSRRLLEKAHTEKPNDFVLFDNAVFIEFEEPSLNIGDDEDSDTVPVTETGTLFGIIFEKKLLNDAIGRSLVPSLGAEEHVTVQNLEDLAFTFKDKETTNPSNSTNLSFFLRGTPRVVWVFDEETLRGDLVGKPKSELKTLLSGFPSINKAEVVLRPVWKRTFPKDVKNIKVELIINE
ncbi:MAG TPA: hypothetical protein VJB70_04140 [Candidatus Paceibacterota bacterium]